MTNTHSIAHIKENKKEYYKTICNGFDCEEIATDRIDVSLGEFGITDFFLCKRCKEKILSKVNL